MASKKICLESSYFPQKKATDSERHIFDWGFSLSPSPGREFVGNIRRLFRGSLRLDRLEFPSLEHAELVDWTTCQVYNRGTARIQGDKGV